MEDNNNRRKAYDRLSEYYNMPSYEEFEREFDDDAKQKQIYDRLSEYYNMPSYEEFSNEMRGQTQPAEPEQRENGERRTGFMGQRRTAPWRETSEMPEEVAQRKVAERPAENGSEPVQAASIGPLGPDRFGRAMEIGKTVSDATRNAMERMEAIRKGNTPFSGGRERRYNPATKQFENVYYTPTGEIVGSETEQQRARMSVNEAFGQTELGEAYREAQMKADKRDRVWGERHARMQGYDKDFGAASEAAWEMAGRNTTAAQSRTVQSAAFAFGDPLSNAVLLKADQMSNYDLGKMSEDAWANLGKDKQEAIISDYIGMLKDLYRDGDGEGTMSAEEAERILREQAEKMARAASDQKMYEVALAKNAPENVVDFFLRKTVGANMITKLVEAAARATAGSSSAIEMRDMATQRYEEDGHRVAGLAGTVVGMGLDPTAWAAGAVGGAAVKGAMWLGGRFAGDIAVRKFGTTLAGRVLSGVVGGAGNFGTFESGNEMLEQMRIGGHRNEETGEIEDYDLGAVAGKFGHGVLMGAASGAVAPLLGNVSDKLVRATSSTMGKMGIRAGQLGVSTLAEGTIFSVPEWIEGDRDAMDVWTDNLAMMLAFKGQHVAKSGARAISNMMSCNQRIAELRGLPRREVLRGWETRLREALDGAEGMSLTREEADELDRAGYGDLKQLVEDYNQYIKGGDTDKGRIDAERLLTGRNGNIPYNRFEMLMNDGAVSEAARAKIYYYLTGKTLPMSTVMGSSVIEYKDDEGNVTGYTVRSIGANGIITSRNFSGKDRADIEIEKINRQAELNSIDIGERYYDRKSDQKRMYEACEAVARERGVPARSLYDMMQKGIEGMSAVELEWAEEVARSYDEIRADKYASNGIRNDINEEYGVDIDAVIKKEPNRRDKAEQEALDEYMKRLWVDVEREGRGEGVEYERGYNANDEGRNDIMMELAMSEDNADTQEAYEGMVQRVNDDADMMVAEHREAMRPAMQADGTLHPAVLKEKEPNGNDKTIYIISGNVVMSADGTTVDPEASDRSIVIYDPSTGERRMIDPAGDMGILSVGEVTTVEDFEARLEREKQAFVQAEIEAASGKVTIEPGYTFNMEDGGQAVVTEVNGDSVVYATEGGRVGETTVSVVQAIADAMRLADYRERHPEAEQQAQAGRNAESQEATEAQREEATVPADESAEASTAPAAGDEPMPMREDGEPDFMATTSERGHRYIYDEAGLSQEEASKFVKANIDAAEKELKKLEGKVPKMGTSLTKYQQEKAAHQQQVEQAQAVLDYWNGVRAEHQRVVAAERAEQAERDRVAHDAAVLAEQQRQAEELAKQQEQAARGSNSVAPHITEKWNASPKVEGVENEITLANGETVKGRYMLIESGAATPSHNPNMEFARNEGFPVDENGQTVNDRDYERDQQAQQITRDMADRYDSRALQNVPVVSQDGVVLSGNGRTMAGELAAQQGTDGAYIEHLKKYPQQFGFTPEQVEAFINGVNGHPRVVFVPEVDMPYTTETFAKFNAQDMKSQSRTEQSVKLGKTVDDATFGRIVRSINAFDTLGDFYNDPKAAPTAIGELHKAGVINQMQVAEMMDGEKVSGQGRQMLENMLIGKAFESNPDAVRQLAEFPAMRQSVVSALAEIANNIHLGEDYPWESELAQAIDLAYQARKSGIGAGEKVSGFARQQSLFPFDEGETVADYTNATVLMLADCLNDGRVSQLKKVLALYNDHAAQSAAGQYDIFSGGVKSKEEITKDVLNILNNGTKTEQQTALAGAAERRKEAAGVRQDGVAGNSDAGSGVERNREDNVQPPLSSDAEVEELLARMSDIAEVMPNTTLTPETWMQTFGINNSLSTPIGDVKMGENQYNKLVEKQRTNEFGMVVRTLQSPDVILVEASESVDDAVERSTSYVFVKTFIKEDGTKVVRYESVTVSQDGMEVSISSHRLRENQLREKLKRDGLLYKATALDAPANTSAEQPTNGGSLSSETDAETEPQQPNDAVSSGSSLSAGETSGISSTEPTGEPTVSKRKDTNNSETEQEKVVSAIKSAEAEVDTNPTEGQKKAGNYKMGHVTVDGYDITIEQPKGSIRRGTDDNGKQWEQEMHNTYGYIRGTEGVDGDHIDVFLSDDPTSGDVFVVDQVDQMGIFDEHKVMYGFADIESARQAYLSNYEPGWKGLGAITPVSKEAFKKWIESSKRKMKPFSEYRSVETLWNVQLGEGAPLTLADMAEASDAAVPEDTATEQPAEEQQAGTETTEDGGKLRADIPARNIDAVVKELGRMGVRVKSEEETEKRRRMVDDSELIERLESEPKETGYRNVVLNADGTLGSPMASKLGRKGVGRSATSGFAFGSWEQADENPDMATDDGKIDLIKPDGKAVGGVDYNPYIHIRPTLVNKQFKQAWERPNLVYVETEYPSSELTSGYRAEKAKKAVGRHDWNGGELILSRWDKPVRIVPWERVADDWEQEFKGEGIPFDIIPPRLLPILAERGMEILPPHKGMGKACNDAYERWKADPEAYYGQPRTAVQREGEADGDISYGDWFDQGSVERIGAFRGDSRKRIDAMKESQKASVRKRLEEQIEKMGLKDRVVMVESADELGDVSEEDRRSKGWYDVETGKIVIVLDNHTSSDDVIATILHEGVAHYGLRQLFGKHFDTFLDNVYASATKEVRGAITNLAANKYGWDIREATEEYIAGLAEDTDFESPERQSWWAQIKRFFWDMLHKLGIAGQHIKDAISDNELRYLLWRSYQNLVNPGRYRGLVEEAEDIAMQWNLKVGKYEERYGELRSERAGRWYAPARAAESGMRLHRDGDGTPRALARDSYEAYEGKQRHRREIEEAMAKVVDAMESGDQEAIENASAELEKLIQTDDKNDGEKEHRAGDVVEKPAAVQKALRDGLVKLMQSAGLDVVADKRVGQRTLDKFRELARLMGGPKRKTTSDTRKLNSPEGEKAYVTVISDAESGAKVRKNLDTLAKKYEEKSSRLRNLLNDIAEALGAKQRGSGSKYVTIEAQNGNIVTIRLANHNASVRTFDNNGEPEGVSIVVAGTPNNGIENNGDAHVVEFFYRAQDLRSAEGKPLVSIIRSVEQMLYSGEYKDTTGLAQVQEVNTDTLREMRAYHGSGADFDAFDHSHMGEGEGAQAYGWGTYVTEVEGIGKMYAERNPFSYVPKIAFRGEVLDDIPLDYLRENPFSIEKAALGIMGKARSGYSIEGAIKDEIDRIKKQLSRLPDDEFYTKLLKTYEELSPEDFSLIKRQPTLYTVDIPDDNGSNYLEWDQPIGEENIGSLLVELEKHLLTNDDYYKEQYKGHENDLIANLESDFKSTDEGRFVYENLAGRLGSDKAASEFLHSMGYVGIKYPAEYMSGGRSDGAKNYVVFDEGDLKITDKARLFRTEEGEVLGYTMDGKIYIDPSVATAETPIHEYTHLWTEALRKANPEAWERLKEEMRQQEGLMDYVRSKYPELTNEDELMDEVFAHYSGRRGAERLESDMREAMAQEPDLTLKAQVALVFHKLRDALQKFWTMARDLFAGKVKGLEKLTAEDFADMALGDLLRGFDPRGEGRQPKSAGEARDREYMAAVERGDMDTAQRMVDEAAAKAMPDTKIVDENGTPRVVYHQTANVFTVFNPRHHGAGTNDNQMPFGVYLKPTDSNIGIQGERQMALFADIKNPLHFADRTALSSWLVENVPGYREAKAEYERIDREYDNRFEALYSADGEKYDDLWERWHNGEISEEEYQRAIDEVDSTQPLLDEWHEAENRQSAVMKNLVDDYMRASEYDGIVIDNDEGSFGRTTSTILALNPAQVKSADAVTYDDQGNVIPLSKRFDKRKADIRYQKGDNRMSMEQISEFMMKAAAKNKSDAKARNYAMRFIGVNLDMLCKAMRLQKEFDRDTVKRVTSLAKAMLGNGYLDGLRSNEVSRLLSAVERSTGEDNINEELYKVMDIMIDNQLRHAEEALHKLESVRGSRVDVKGVEVQGQLDVAGQRMVETFKKARQMQRKDVEERMAEAENRMGSDDEIVANEAAQEHAGMQMALNYIDNIQASETSEEELQREIREEERKIYRYDQEPVLDEDGKPMMKKDGTPMMRTVRHIKPEYKDTKDNPISEEKKREREQVRQTVKAIEEAIRKEKTDRLQAYMELVGNLGGTMKESMARAKERREAERKRVAEIQHNANSDMEGRPSNEHHADTETFLKRVNNLAANTIFAPLGTFTEMLRLFGSKSAGGEGYLFNRFVRGLIDARQKEIRGVRGKYTILDAKAREVFGEGVKNWADVMKEAAKGDKISVDFWDGGKMRLHKLHQGNLMYIYMVDKMSDGRMKLRKMGVSEEAVEAITKKLDPRLKELADWLQEEFLVDTRKEYNETHKRMFGASMAEVENYFPLKILANARVEKPEDLDAPERNEGISTQTGSIIKRKTNTLALDLMGADALHVILDHVAQMEHWNAFAEYNRDLNTLRTYKRFRNQVQNMTTIYGNGKELWKKFNEVCQIAVGAYHPKQHDFDKGALEFAQGVTAAKVSFRVNTALKQLLSLPAYLPYVNAKGFYRSVANNIKGKETSFQWCLEHLPMFEERWKSKVSGDPRLAKTAMDWQSSRANFVQKVSRAGMLPNAFIDALTVSIGAHAVYETRLNEYLKSGYQREAAEKRAIQDAEIAYNETQQSSEGGFLSTMQSDRTWLSVMFTVFRNSSMAYQRQLHGALRNIGHNLTKAQRAATLAFETKQMVRDGVPEERAEAAAKSRRGREMRKNALAVATFGYIVQFAWNLGGKMWYLLFGDDDDEKEEMWDDIWVQSMFGGVEGLTGGDVMSEFGRQIVRGDYNPRSLDKDMPLSSDLARMMQKFGQGKGGEALNDMVNLLVQAGIGVNPQSLTDAVLATVDLCGGDLEFSHEALLFATRVLQVPQSQIKKLYFDEIGMSGEEAQKMSVEELVERYARYQVKRGRLATPWEWDDEELLKKERDKGMEAVRERMGHMDTEELLNMRYGGKGMKDEVKKELKKRLEKEPPGSTEANEAYERYEAQFNELDKRVKEARELRRNDPQSADLMIEDIRNDEHDYKVYTWWKPMDEMYDAMAKELIKAKSIGEYDRNMDILSDYREKMVTMLDEEDESKASSMRMDLINMYLDFMSHYKEKPKHYNPKSLR